MQTPYLLSSALSPAHHALVHRLENATSPAEVDAVCRAELDRIQHRLDKGKGKVKEAEISEALILLLYLDNHRTFPVSPHQLDSALVQALNLAEGGESKKTRALGCLYLSLSLRPSDDLSLLHFNSIIKDLQSVSVASVLQALRAIVHTPSADLAPAVQRQVVHLVSHKSADVRRLALAALSALADHAPDALEGLRDRKIWKRLRDKSPAVALQAVKITRKMLSAEQIETTPSADALHDLLRATLRSATEADALLAFELTSSLLSMTSRMDNNRLVDVTVMIQDVFRSKWPKSSSKKALALHIVSSRSELAPTVLPSLLPFLSPIIKSPLLSQSPNETYFALRCLDALSMDEVGEILGDPQAMESLTLALQSEDPAIRRKSLRLLGRLSPDLPAMHFDRLLQAFHRSSDDRTVLASRAVEVAKVISASESAPRSGETFGRRVVQLLEMDKGDIVLEQVIQETLDWLHEVSQEEQTAFVSTLRELTASIQVSGNGVPRTLSVLVSAVLCEFAVSSNLRWEYVWPVLTRICLGADGNASTQQAALVAMSGLCATLGEGKAPPDVVKAVEKMGEQASKYVRKRCEAFLRVASSSEDFKGLAPLMTDPSLPIVMSAFDTYAKTLPRSSPSSKPSSLVVSPRRKQSSLGLKYDAYPTAGSSGGKTGRPTRKKEKVERDGRLEGSLGLLSLHEEQKDDFAPDKDDEGDTSSPFQSSPVDERRSHA